MRHPLAVARRFAFSTARGIGKRDIATHLFCICQPVLPLTRVGRSAGAVAFHHPAPSWEGHVLVTPTRRCPALLHPRRPRASRAASLWATVALARTIAHEAEDGRYRYLIVNGGERQDVGHLHGHLTGSLPQAGFAGPDDPADDPERYLAFAGVPASARGFEAWLKALEDLQVSWPDPDTGFSLILPLGSHEVITIYVDASDSAFEPTAPRRLPP